jgi:hypothetical protein
MTTEQLPAAIDLTGAPPMRAFDVGLRHGLLLKDVDLELANWRSLRDRVAPLCTAVHVTDDGGAAVRLRRGARRIHEEAAAGIERLEAIQHELLLSPPGGLS